MSRTNAVGGMTTRHSLQVANNSGLAHALSLQLSYE